MAIPDFQTIMLPFVQALNDGQTWTMKELTERLAIHFNLSDSERHELLPSGSQTVFSNRVAWAKSHLKHAGLIANPSRGKVTIAEVGRQILQQNPEAINCKLLKQFPSYLKFIGAVTSGDSINETPTTDETVMESIQTPLELIESSFQTLRKETEEELLTKLKTCSPAFFERVVVQLLRAMGYGGVTGEGSVTGQSGDGVLTVSSKKTSWVWMSCAFKRSDIRIQRLADQSSSSLLAVWTLFKRTRALFSPRPSLALKPTISSKRFVGKKVVLIDGQKVAGLMLDHNVGVSRSKIYELKEVSNDFFDEDEG